MRATLFFLVLLFAQPCFAAEFCLEKPSGKLVNDYANLFSASKGRALEQELINFDNTTSNQIVVVTHPDFCNMPKWLFATQIGEKWGVGQQEFDNGIVIVVKPKTQGKRGEIFIAVGNGLRGAITDFATKTIIDNEIIPKFKAGNIYGGLKDGIEVLKELASGEITELRYAEIRKQKEVRKKILAAVLLFCIFVLIPFISTLIRARKYAKVNNVSLWDAFWLLAQNRMSHRGSYRMWSGGRSRSSGGGFGGGGFGGFGGGSFGGGGAGGSW